MVSQQDHERPVVYISKLMSCQSCSGETNFNTFFLPCRVCQLCDGDDGAKWVAYCELCKSYICRSCWSNPVRRAKAVL